MSKILIVANWKMNPKSQKEALALFEVIRRYPQMGLTPTPNKDSAEGAKMRSALYFLRLMNLFFCFNTGITQKRILIRCGGLTGLLDLLYLWLLIPLPSFASANDGSFFIYANKKRDSLRVYR